MPKNFTGNTKILLTGQFRRLVPPRTRAISTSFKARSRSKCHYIDDSLIRPFVLREAVYSSRIEGTQATLGELLAAEAGAIPDRSPEDLREIGNYVAALEHGMKRLKTLPLSLRLVRELHEKLMNGVFRIGRFRILH